MKRFVQARVNGGSNYDSLKGAVDLTALRVGVMADYIEGPPDPSRCD